jgi:hypothetical protein
MPSNSMDGSDICGARYVVKGFMISDRGIISSKSGDVPLRFPEKADNFSGLWGKTFFFFLAL